MSELKLVRKRTLGNRPTIEYELRDGNEYVGFIQIRLKLSHSKEVPPAFASHIYYEIEPSKQGRGYGREILKLGLEEARMLGLPEVIITCFEDNLASRKIIEANGGVLSGSTSVGGKNFLKFKIRLK